jgi:hypothetical protein
LIAFTSRTVGIQRDRATALGKDNGTIEKFFTDENLGNPSPTHIDMTGAATVASMVSLLSIALHIIVKEFDLLKVRLLRASPELFAEVDRGFAEAEFRLAIVPPLAALAGLMAFTESPLWGIAFLALAGLAAQGIARARTAGDRLVDTLVIEEIKSPLLERLERAVDEAPSAREVAANETTDRPPAGS